MKILLLVLLGVFATASVGNAAPVQKLQAAAIQDLLTALSNDKDATDRSSPYDDSQSEDKDDDDYDIDDDGADDTPPRRADKYGRPESLAVVSRIQADIQDVLNGILSMYDRGTKFSSRYDANEEDAEPEDDAEEESEYDNDEGAGDQLNVLAEDEYNNDRPSDNLDLVQLMRMQSAMLESLPAKTGAHLQDYTTKAKDQFQIYPVGFPYKGKYNTKVAKAFINSLPEKVMQAKLSYPNNVLSRSG